MLNPCELVHELGCRLLRQNTNKLLIDDLYRNPGPLQFDGPGADAKVMTLCVEDQDYMGRIKKLQEYLDKVITVALHPFIASFPNYTIILKWHL